MDTLPFDTLLPIPDIYSAKRILCIQPHYDDNDIGAAALFGSTKIPSSDPTVDSAYEPHHLIGIAFNFTREPNYFSDADATWEKQVEAVKCYEA